jgi:hypothetical protein
MATITSANAILMLAVTPVFPVPQRIQGFATDDSFDVEAAEFAQVMMGVDGKMSAGYVPAVTRMTINLQADSASMSFFENWDQAQKVALDLFPASGTITLPSLSKSYTMSNGVMTSLVQAPRGGKVLQPRAFVITWESITPALI